MDQTKTHNPLNLERPLPVDIILSPSWWYEHTGMTFDPDFFYHPLKRVESEQKMEQVLYDRWGQYGLGQKRSEIRPEIGAVHLAAGFIISEMLGCKVDYLEDNPPQVIPAGDDSLIIDEDAAFQTDVYQNFLKLCTSLKSKYGWLSGDVNWGGILNIALDLRGQELFMDMLERPDQVKIFFTSIGHVITRFVKKIQEQTGTSSISVNRNVVNIPQPVFLHSECSNTMISVEHYREFLFTFDEEWCRGQRPFGIHHCGTDPHRFAKIFAEVPHLDFLDVGWGGDLKILRKNLPKTFLNIRLSPVEIIHQSETEINDIISGLVKESQNAWLTGVCCINMDDKVSDENVSAIFESVNSLRKEMVGEV